LGKRKKKDPAGRSLGGWASQEKREKKKKKTTSSPIKGKGEKKLVFFQDEGEKRALQPRERFPKTEMPERKGGGEFS